MKMAELHVDPAPVATVVQVSKATVNGKGVVVLWVHTPVGLTIAHIDPDTADVVGQGMIESARKARSGLEVVGGNGTPPAS